MIDFDIFHTLTQEKLFTAKIDCRADAPESILIGEAVRWAIEERISLAFADIPGANLEGLDLSYLNLEGANFKGCNLIDMDISYSNMRGCCMIGSDLSHSCAHSTNFINARMDSANLSSADFTGAYFFAASMCFANISDACFHMAEIDDADIQSVFGVNDWIKCIQTTEYPISYTQKTMKIGCQHHNISEWKGFSVDEILSMDGSKGLMFWRKHKNWIFETIEMFPARPTHICDSNEV